MSDPDPAFAAFCSAGLWPGLGRTLAEQLPRSGITSPDHVTSARLAAVPGVTTKRAERLVDGFAKVTATYDVVALLVPAGLEARLAARVHAVLGESAEAVLRADPWRLLEVADVPVREADRLAATLGGQGPDDPRRGRAVAGAVLARAARSGHTALAVDDLLSGLRQEGVRDAPAALGEATEGGTVLVDDGLVALDRYAAAEAAVARGVARLAATAEPFPAEADAAFEEETAGLDEAQRRAVAAALRHGVSLLTGGPGTGKSRTVAAVVRLARAGRRRVALAAPTGRAAKRLEELGDEPASTLHRLLQAQGTTGGFGRDGEYPVDADLVVVDETSMLDVELAAALLEACADGTHLLLVGDPAQLPSIGPGRVLGDLLDSGAVPVTELSTLYRQAEGGAIARLAAAVRSGELPAVDRADREVVVVPVGSAGEAAHRAVQLVTDSIPRALGIPAATVQVVTPVHRGDAGTTALNAALKAVLNPGRGATAGFDVGDRVVATANHLDVGFANGEVGVVTGDADKGGLEVAFATGPCTVPADALPDLRHGWAITVHRAQGSEWPAVVAVLPPEAGGMLTRPLVYTAMTRAQRHLSIVPASGPALRRAVREVGGRPRTTRLRALLTREPAAVAG